MNVKRLAGSEGRRALYALAAVTGEVVLALGGDREELRALVGENEVRFSPRRAWVP